MSDDAWFPRVAPPCEVKGRLVFLNWYELLDLDPREAVERPKKRHPFYVNCILPKGWELIATIVNELKGAT